MWEFEEACHHEKIKMQTWWSWQGSRSSWTLRPCRSRGALRPNSSSWSSNTLKSRWSRRNNISSRSSSWNNNRSWNNNLRWSNKIHDTLYHSNDHRSIIKCVDYLSLQDKTNKNYILTSHRTTISSGNGSLSCFTVSTWYRRSTDSVSDLSSHTIEIRESFTGRWQYSAHGNYHRREKRTARHAYQRAYSSLK